MAGPLHGDNHSPLLYTLNATELYEVTTIAGSKPVAYGGWTDATGTSAEFYSPYGGVLSKDGNELYVIDTKNNCIRTLDLATKAVTTIAGSGSYGSTDAIGTSAKFKEPYGGVLSKDGNELYVMDGSNLIRALDLATKAVTTIAGSAGSHQYGSTDATGTIGHECEVQLSKACST